MYMCIYMYAYAVYGGGGELGFPPPEFPNFNTEVC